MRTWMLLAALAALGLVLAACPKKEGGEPGKTEPTATEPAKTEPAKTEPAKTEPAKTEPTKEEPKEEAKKEEPKEGAKAEGAGGPEENCGALYDFTKQLTEAFAKKAGGKVGKELPPREKFIAACKELPPEVSRCMNPQVAMKEAARCQEVMNNADAAKVAKFKKMLGGK